MVFRSTQSLTGMSTRNISWGDKCGRWLELTTFPIGKLGSHNFPETEEPIQTFILMVYLQLEPENFAHRLSIDRTQIAVSQSSHIQDGVSTEECSVEVVSSKYHFENAA